MDQLRTCPFCKFGKEQYAEHAKRVKNPSPYEHFRPVQQPDGSVYCQNCHVTVTWAGRRQDISDGWNIRED